MRFSFEDKRLVELERELRPGIGPCPLVVLGPTAANIRLTHFSAGRDATYVLVEDAGDRNAKDKTSAITIGYAPFVDGTTLIYDLTDETLQGKARPFICNLSRNGRHVYAMLPVQIEAIRIRLRAGQIEVAFLDACGERIAAALPFMLTLSGANGEPVSSYACTDCDGHFVRARPTSMGSMPADVTVRSLLTGREERITLRP